MPRNKTLYSYMHDVLKEKHQRALSMEHGRHEHKRITGEHTHSDLIWSDNSYKAHIGRIKQFWTYVKDNYPELKKSSIEDIDRSVAVDFLKHQHESGKSASTLSSDMAALNKTFDFELRKSDEDLELPSRHIDNFVNNRSGVDYEDLQPKQREMVDISRSFGLRRSEIQELTDKSIVEHEDRLYAYVCGKGGRVRLAECLADKEDEMRERYEPYIKQVNDLDSLPAHRSGYKEYMEDSQRIEKSFGHDAPIHRLGRQFYAQELLHQVEREDRHEELLFQNRTKSNIDTYSTNGITMRRDHAQIVSKALGHNRVDILKNYIM